MAYELHIKRRDGDISLDEWCSAVRNTDGVRLKNQDAVAVNPATGEEIRVPSAQGDAEVLRESGGFLGVDQKQEWARAFRFSHGRASFRASDAVKSSTDSVHRAAARLAATLSASIIGDEGESYDW
jgi:hypothetical protein